MAIQILKKNIEPLSVIEIWQEAERIGLTKKLSAKGKTPKKTLQTVFYTDFKKTNRTFEVHGRKPKKFTLTES